MQSSNQPGKISLPFANSGAKQPIPVASQVGIEDGRASYTDGFPPLTRTPLAAGGKPPFGTDMNGILNAITAIQQWQSAGGMFMYDSALSTAIGGYPKGAFVLKADASGFWQSTAENNTANPDTGGAGWIDQTSGSLLGVQTFSTNGTFVYTPTPGTKSVIVEVQGGGGGGGSSLTTIANRASAGPGGGAGGYAKSRLMTGFSGVSVTVGVGGAAGSSGGNSSFGALITANGGSGAPAGPVYSAFPIQDIGSDGGSATGGNMLNVTGDSGGSMMLLLGSGNGISGKGGGSKFASPTRSVADSQAGVAGQYGSGGSGAISQNGASGFTGGSGGNGIVVIHEYS